MALAKEAMEDSDSVDELTDEQKKAIGEALESAADVDVDALKDTAVGNAGL